VDVQAPAFKHLPLHFIFKKKIIILSNQGHSMAFPYPKKIFF